MNAMDPTTSTPSLDGDRVSWFRDGLEIEPAAGTGIAAGIVDRVLGEVRDHAAGGARERAIPVDQTHTSVIVDERRVVKIVGSWGAADRAAAILERLRDALGRREGRGAMVVGIPGVGRSALLRAYAAQATMPVVLLRHVELVARMRGAEGEAVRGVVGELRRAGAVVALDPLAPWLLARDVPDDVQCELRALLASGDVPWVAIATPEESRRLSESESWIDLSLIHI